MQLDRQLSWQLQLQMQSQQQQQQQQMLQLQQLETAASAAAQQQLTSLKLELQQRQQAQEAQLLAAMVTSGMPATSVAVSNALVMQAPRPAGMTCQGMDGSLLYVQGASCALEMPVQSMDNCGSSFVGIGSSNMALGSGSMAGCMAGAAGQGMLPSAAAAAGAVGLAGVDLSTSLLPQAGQCYQIVHDAAAAAPSMIVSEGLLMHQQQQQLMVQQQQQQQLMVQQQQQQLMATGGMPDMIVMSGQLPAPGYSGSYNL
jgi:hypothetical protein